MSNLKLAAIHDYASAMSWLDGRFTARIGHNTTVERDEYDWSRFVTVRYHGNAILRYYENGDIALRHVGWVTPTTTLRLNMLTPPDWRVFRRGGMMHVETPRHAFLVENDWSHRRTLTNPGERLEGWEVEALSGIRAAA